MGPSRIMIETQTPTHNDENLLIFEPPKSTVQPLFTFCYFQSQAAQQERECVTFLWQ
jgi:hypothetical protein